MPANDGAAEASLYGVRDLPLPTMTHMRLQRVLTASSTSTGAPTTPPSRARDK